MAEAVDSLNYARLFLAECISPYALDLRKAEEVRKMLPKAHVVTDCKSLFDALERNESAGLGLSEKRTAIEVTATKQQMEASGIETRLINSDRQFWDILTKQNANP